MTEKVITSDKRWARIVSLRNQVYGYGSGNQRTHGLTHIKIRQTDTGFKFVPLDEAWRLYHTHKMPDIKSSAFSELIAIVERLLEMNRKQDELVEEMYEFSRGFKEGKFEEDEDMTPNRLDNLEEFIDDMKKFREDVENWMKTKENPEYDDETPVKKKKKSKPEESSEGEDEEERKDVDYGDVDL